MSCLNHAEVERILLAAPFTRDLGLRLESVAPGECRTSLILEERHLQQDGYVHAGVQATMADHTAGAAGATLVEPGQYVLSAEFKINLLRSAKGTRLACVAKVLKAGASLTIVESEVFCGTGDDLRLVSKTTVTLAVLRARTEA